MGYALVSLPLAGRTSPVFSWLWLAFGMIVCLGIVLALLRQGWEVATGLLGLAAALAVYAAVQQVAVWPALLAVAAVTAAALPVRSWYARVRARGRRGRI